METRLNSNIPDWAIVLKEIEFSGSVKNALDNFSISLFLLCFLFDQKSLYIIRKTVLKTVLSKLTFETTWLFFNVSWFLSNVSLLFL